ncbi:MAG: ATP-binding protein, partial [Verrucomicrobiaceae bacterium]
MRKVPVPALPNARRTIAALRDIGYDFNSAVADLVDNSVSAGARLVSIEVSRDETGFQMTLEDDGVGMSPGKLLEALRLGSESEYRSDSLGKYGMGLKTASLSQCRTLVVVSCNGGEDARGYALDLDHISRGNSWELLELHPEDLAVDPRYERIIQSGGTIVLWEGLDRMEKEFLGFRRPGAAENWFGRLIRDLELHLRITFHRFLEGTARDGSVNIYVNGKSLKPWDPFCRSEPNTTRLKKYSFTVREGTSSVNVAIEPFVLPVREGEYGFSSAEAWQEAAGLLPWNDSQGYYVYRRDRLIHCGGWLRTRAKDEHSKYARVGIFFDDDEADELFSISVNKAQLRLPASLFEYLKGYVNVEVVKSAQRPYRCVETRKKSQTTSSSSSKIGARMPGILKKHQVEVRKTERGDIEVTNPRGSFRANSERDAVPFKVKSKFSVQPGLV